MRDFLLYGIIRLALWAVLWWLLTVAGIGVIMAGILAAIIAMLLSFLFLSRIRNAAVMRWKDADERRRAKQSTVTDEDAAEEDALLGDDGDDDVTDTGR